MYKKKLEIYDKLVSTNSKFKRKGKTMPYTSANGYMFSLLNKNGDIGIRFSKEVQEKLFEKHQTTYFKSHGAVIKGYVLIPENLYDDMELLASYLDDSYHYVMSLKPK